MKSAFGYVSLWTGCFSEDFDISDVNVEFELSMPSIDSTSLSTQIHWNSVCAYNWHFLPVLHFHVFCVYCPVSPLEKLAQAAKAIDAVISFSNVFSTKKVLSVHKIGLCWFFFLFIFHAYMSSNFFCGRNHTKLF